MKVTVFILTIWLVFQHVTLTLIDRDGEFLAERHLWRLLQTYNELSQDPEAVPRANFESLSQSYQSFPQKFKESKFIPLAEAMAGKVFILRKDYQTAQQIFAAALKKYSNKADIAVPILMESAKTYEITESWEEMLAAYQRVMDEYPTSEQGLRVPLLVARFYANRQELQLAQKAFDNAVTHYQKIYADNPGTKVAFDAKRSIGICYITQNRWESAFETLSEAFLEFSDAEFLERSPNLPRTINNIALVHLNDYERALNVYHQFLEKHPEHKFKAYIDKTIETLNTLRDNKIQFQVQPSDP